MTVNLEFFNKQGDSSKMVTIVSYNYFNTDNTILTNVRVFKVYTSIRTPPVEFLFVINGTKTKRVTVTKNNCVK